MSGDISEQVNIINRNFTRNSADAPDAPITPSAVEVDYNFDEVTDRCDKEACPPVNCASPYIPLGECCPVCPPQEVSYEARGASTSGMQGTLQVHLKELAV